MLLTQVGNHSGVTTAAFTLFNDLVPPTAIDAVWKSAAAWGAEGFGDYGVFVCVLFLFSFYFSIFLFLLCVLLYILLRARITIILHLTFSVVACRHRTVISF
jgi:hypothetical protein